MTQMANFAKMCAIWHMDRFWHIHLNVQQSEFHRPDRLEMMKLVGSKTKLPIRWSCLGSDVQWITNGEIASPYEPCQYSVVGARSFFVETNWNGFDSSNGLISNQVDTRYGTYSATWKDDGGTDSPCHLYTSVPTRAEWGHMLETHTEVKQMSDSLKLSFSVQDTVTVINKRVEAWITPDGVVYPRPITPGNRKYTRVVDSGVIERGSIMPDGTPVMTRLIDSRVYQWWDPQYRPPTSFIINATVTSPSIKLDRHDGPAVVTINKIKQQIIGDRTVLSLPASHHHDWFMHGAPLDPQKMTTVIARNGLIMREGPLHEHPAFPRAEDVMAWTANFR